jgi:ferritin-like metal-binding protein YciE
MARAVPYRQTMITDYTTEAYVNGSLRCRITSWGPKTRPAAKVHNKDLLTDEIKDLYSAEKQLTKAIPKMAKGSNHPALKEAFSGHLKETLAQVTRLEKAGELLGIKVTGKKCVGMEGCIEEGAEALEEDGEESILDLGLIGAGSRVEHYEMAGYLTAISLAKRMGAADVVNLLQQSLAEEQNAEKTLRSPPYETNRADAIAGDVDRSARCGRRAPSSQLAVHCGIQ